MLIRANVQRLDWESDFFALNSGKLDFATDAPQLSARQLDAYRLVQAKVPADNLALLDGLSALNFRLAEGEIDLVLPLDRPPNDSKQDELKIIPAGEAWIPRLRAIAEQAFRLSRFRPPWYQPQDSGRFYALWVEKAVLGTFDHLCLLALDPHNNLLGFATLRFLSAQDARIGLLAVCPGYEGKGIGSRLLAAVKEYCRQRENGDQQKICQLRIATQTSNTAALRLYLKLGAAIDSTQYWLYRGKQ